MTLKEKMKRDALVVHLNTGQMAEMGLYLPLGVNPRQVKVVVARHRASPAAEDNSRTIVGDFEICMSRDPYEGAQSITTGKDKFILAEHEGGPNVETLIVEIVDADPGMWKLALRK